MHLFFLHGWAARLAHELRVECDIAAAPGELVECVDDLTGHVTDIPDGVGRQVRRFGDVSGGGDHAGPIDLPLHIEPFQQRADRRVVGLYRSRNYAEARVTCSERLGGGGSLVNWGCVVVGMITGFPGMPAPRPWAGSALVVSRPGR